MIQCLNNVRNVPPRDSRIYKFGTQESQDFCQDYQQSFIQLNITDEIISQNKGMIINRDKNGNILEVVLAQTNKQQNSNQLFLNAMNYENGFIMKFNMNITKILEGFAIVLHQSEKNIEGKNGAGLGYSGIKNSLAIEFDNKYSYIKNDPYLQNERHISVIVSQNNQADESESIGWNDNPVNYNDEEGENYIPNANVEIRFLNRNLEIKIDGILQLGIYHDIRLNEILNLQSNQFYLGFTSSSNQIDTDQSITNLSLQILRPNLVKLKEVKPILYQLGDLYEFHYYIYDGCNNTYIPVSPFDSNNDVSIQSNCTIQDINTIYDQSQIYQYSFFIKCLSTGKQFIDFLYKGKLVQNYKLKIISQEVSTITAYNLIFDKNLQQVSMSLKLFDKYNQTSFIKEQKLKELIQIQFKCQFNADLITNIDYEVINDKDNSVINITFAAQQIGQYKLKQKHDKINIQGQFSIQVEYQKLDLFKSYIQILNSQMQIKNTSLLNVGHKYVIRQHLYDTIGFPYQDKININYNIDNYEFNTNTFIVNKTGQFLLTNNLDLRCNNCNLTFTNQKQPIDYNSIQICDVNTKNITQSINLNQNQQFVFELQFRDQYDNLQQIPFINSLNIQFQNKSNHFQLCYQIISYSIIVFSCENNQFQPSKGLYNIIIIINSQTIIRPLNIIINNTQISQQNEDISLIYSNSNPQQIQLLSCQDSGFFTLQIKNSKNKIVDNQIEKRRISIETVNKNDKYDIKLMSCNKLNEFTVLVRRTFNCSNENENKLNIKVDGKLVSVVKIQQISEMMIAYQNTQLVTALPESMKSQSNAYISLKIVDNKGRIVNDQSQATNLRVEIIQGNATIDPFVYDPIYKQYDCRVQPLYSYNQSLLIMQVQYYNSSVMAFNSLFDSLNIYTRILQNLNIKNSLFSSSINRAFVDKDLNFKVYLRDDQGFCYDNQTSLILVIQGPYRQQIVKLKDKKKIIYNFPDNGFNNQTITVNYKLKENDDICNSYYDVLVEAGTIQKAGNYDFYLYNNEDLSQYYLQKNIIFKEGEIFINNTAIQLFDYQGSLNQVQFNAGVEFKFKIDFYDQFLNLVEFTNQSVSLILNLNESQYSQTQIKNRSLIISLKVFKTGEIKRDMNISINNYIYDVELIKCNLPNTISIIPAEISNQFYQIKVEKIALVGIEQFISIQTYDIYGNIQNKQQENTEFQISIMGYDIFRVVKKDVANDLKYYKEGIYKLKYSYGWQGMYQINIRLNFKDYYQTNQYAIFSKCSKERPALCSNTMKCEKSYNDCNFPYLNKKDCGLNKYQCMVNGTLSCVLERNECDCEKDSDMIKCSVNNMCMQQWECEKLKKGFCNKVLCWDGSCRMDEQNCPSKRVCPPGFKMCDNQLCIEEVNMCDIYLTPKYTSVTCSDSMQVVCPDGTCQSSSFYCNAILYMCPVQQIRCPDYSCRDNLEDCPTLLTCPPLMARCQNQICSYNCTDIPNIQTIAIYNRAFNFTVLSPINNTNSNPFSHMLYCQNGQLVDDYSHCGTPITCQQGQVRCVDSSCKDSIKDCIQNTCPKTMFKCWNAQCVTNNTQCPIISTCPQEKPVKCSNGQCVKSIKKCKKLFSCPPQLPYRCNNGECRINYLECSSQIMCPLDKPIKCSDNQCVKSRYLCSLIVMKQVINQKLQVICPDGSVSTSYDICPSIISCNSNEIKCWDNECQTEVSKCRQIPNEQEYLCSNALVPYRCPDNSCASELSQCPSLVICPDERSIRCSDGNCRSSVKECAAKVNCPIGMKLCPSGACIEEKKICGTQITCPKDYVKCWDHNCRKDKRDCLPPTFCDNPLNPIQCPDGTCVSNRYQCSEIITIPCPPDKPLKCPDLKCVKSIQECQELNTNCPIGFSLCSDNSCRISFDLCPADACPPILPLKCLNGQCVTDLNYCDKENGCPYDRIFRCNQNGQCVKDEQDCDKFLEVKCENGFKCDDGSCRESINYCLNNAGCPLYAPIKCLNGNCINPKLQECQVARCDPQFPVQCPNGLCVKSFSECNVIQSIDNPNCNQYSCLDGRCVPYQIMCPPIRACPINYHRCQDGSCRQSIQYCPKNSTICPSNLPYLSDQGICSQSIQQCQYNTGCNKETPFKCKNGLCVQNQNQCKQKKYKKLTNIFNYNHIAIRTIKNIPIQQLFKSINKLQNRNIRLLSLQQYNQNFYQKDFNIKQNITEMVDNTQKEIYENMKEYQEILNKNVDFFSDLYEKIIIKNKNEQERDDCKFICPDYSCANNFLDCNTKNGCPVNKPFKCGNNTCSSTNLIDDESSKCNLITTCLAPLVQCADYSCVQSLSQCGSIQQCPQSTPKRCGSKCIKKEQVCNNRQCPQSKPILCVNGICVADVKDCNFRLSVFCPDEMPYRCATGNCVSQRQQCTLQSQYQFSQIQQNYNKLNQFNQEQRQLQQQDNSYQQQCIVLCPDGSCRNDQSNCNQIQGCTSPNLPYLCSNGNCGKNKLDCIRQIAQQPVTCSPNTKLCEDGICRVTCINYNGCPFSKPLHCLSGICVSEWIECAGYEQCPLDKPYRNYNNTCVSDPFSAKKMFRDIKFDKISMTIYPQLTQKSNFLYYTNSTINYGSVVISHSNIKEQLNSEYELTIESVADELLNKYQVPFEQYQQDDVSQQFPSTQYKMRMNQAVRSPTVRINYLINSISSNINIFITVSYDFMINTRAQKDYCLGKYYSNNQTIACYSKALITNLTTLQQSQNQLSFNINQPGDYAVIYYPVPDSIDLLDNTDDFLQRQRSNIIFIIIILLFLSCLTLFIFYKIFDFFNKLKQSKKTEQKYQENLQYILNLQGTQVSGEGIKDMQLGIFFKKNPSFKVTQFDSKDKVKTIKKLTEQFEKLKEKELNYQKENEELRLLNSQLMDNYQFDQDEDQKQFDEKNLNIDEQFAY